jgi:hypothetical protein
MDGYTRHDFVDVYPARFFLNHATRKGSKQKVGRVGCRATYGK